MANKGVNQVILIGYLGNDPEMNYTAGGRVIATVSLATSESWKDKNSGQIQEKTEWHRVVVFGKLAEICEQYLKKGSQVYFQGKLQTRKWQDKNGQERYTTEVVVDSFTGQMLMLSVNAGQSTQQQAYSNQGQQQRQAPKQQNMVDDDIPF